MLSYFKHYTLYNNIIIYTFEVPAYKCSKPNYATISLNNHHWYPEFKVFYAKDLHSLDSFDRFIFYMSTYDSRFGNLWHSIQEYNNCNISFEPLLLPIIMLPKPRVYPNAFTGLFDYNLSFTNLSLFTEDTSELCFVEALTSLPYYLDNVTGWITFSQAEHYFVDNFLSFFSLIQEWHFDRYVYNFYDTCISFSFNYDFFICIFNIVIYIYTILKSSLFFYFLSLILLTIFLLPFIFLILFLILICIFNINKFFFNKILYIIFLIFLSILSLLYLFIIFIYYIYLLLYLFIYLFIYLLYLLLYLFIYYKYSFIKLFTHELSVYSIFFKYSNIIYSLINSMQTFHTIDQRINNIRIFKKNTIHAKLFIFLLSFQQQQILRHYTSVFSLTKRFYVKYNYLIPGHVNLLTKSTYLKSRKISSLFKDLHLLHTDNFLYFNELYNDKIVTDLLLAFSINTLLTNTYCWSFSLINKYFDSNNFKHYLNFISSTTPEKIDYAHHFFLKKKLNLFSKKLKHVNLIRDLNFILKIASNLFSKTTPTFLNHFFIWESKWTLFMSNKLINKNLIYIKFLLINLFDINNVHKLNVFKYSNQTQTFMHIWFFYYSYMFSSKYNFIYFLKNQIKSKDLFDIFKNKQDYVFDIYKRPIPINNFNLMNNKLISSFSLTRSHSFNSLKEINIFKFNTYQNYYTSIPLFFSMDIIYDTIFFLRTNNISNSLLVHTNLSERMLELLPLSTHWKSIFNYPTYAFLDRSRLHRYSIYSLSTWTVLFNRQSMLLGDIAFEWLPFISLVSSYKYFDSLYFIRITLRVILITIKHRLTRFFHYFLKLYLILSMLDRPSFLLFNVPKNLKVLDSRKTYLNIINSDLNEDKLKVLKKKLRATDLVIKHHFSNSQSGSFGLRKFDSLGYLLNCFYYLWKNYWHKVSFFSFTLFFLPHRRLFKFNTTLKYNLLNYIFLNYSIFAFKLKCNNLSFKTHFDYTLKNIALEGYLKDNFYDSSDDFFVKETYPRLFITRKLDNNLLYDYIHTKGRSLELKGLAMISLNRSFIDARMLLIWYCVSKKNSSNLLFKKLKLKVRRIKLTERGLRRGVLYKVFLPNFNMWFYNLYAFLNIEFGSSRYLKLNSTLLNYTSSNYNNLCFNLMSLNVRFRRWLYWFYNRSPSIKSHYFLKFHSLDDSTFNDFFFNNLTISFQFPDFDSLANSDAHNQDYFKLVRRSFNYLFVHDLVTSLNRFEFIYYGVYRLNKLESKNAVFFKKWKRPFKLNYNSTNIISDMFFNNNNNLYEPLSWLKKKRSFVCKKKLLFSKFFLQKKLNFLDSLLFTNLTKTSFFFHNLILKKNLNLHLKLNGFSFLESVPINIIEKSFIFFNKNTKFNVNLNFSNLYFLNLASDNSLWRYDYLNDFFLKKKNYVFINVSYSTNDYKSLNNYVYLRNKLLFMPFIYNLRLYVFNPILNLIRFNYIVKFNYIIKLMINIAHLWFNTFLYFYIWVVLKLDIFNVPYYIKLFIFFRKLGTILGTLLGDIFIIQFLYYLKWLSNYVLKVNFINLNNINLGNLNAITSKTTKRILFNSLLKIRINKLLNITLFKLNKVIFNNLFIRIFNKLLNNIRLVVFYVSAFSSFWAFYWFNIFIFWRLSLTKPTFFFGLDYVWFLYAFTPFIWAIKWPLISTKPLLHLYIALTSYFTLNSLLFFMFDSYFLLLFSLYLITFIFSFIFIKINFFNIKKVYFFKYNSYKIIIIILISSLIFIGYFFKLFGTSYIHNCIFSFFWEEFLHTLDFFYLHQLHNFIGVTLFYFFFCLFYENFYLRIWILLFSILFFLTECFDHWYAFYYIKRCLFGISFNADYIRFRLPGFEYFFTIIDLQLFLLGGGCIEMYASREQKEAYSVSTLYFREYYRYWWDVQAIYYESRIPFMGMFPDDWFHIKDIYKKNKIKTPNTDNYLASRIYKDTRQLTYFFKDYKINSVEQVISFLEIRFCYGPYVFNDDIIYWIFKSNIINSVHFLCTYLDAFLFFSDFYIMYLFTYVLCYRILNLLNLNFFKKYILILNYIFNIRFTISLFALSIYLSNISSIQYYIKLKSVCYFMLAFIIQFCFFYKSLNFLFTQGHYTWFKGYRYPKGLFFKIRNVLENSDFVWLQFDYFCLNTQYKYCLISPWDPNMYKPNFRYYHHYLVWANFPLPKPFYEQSFWRKCYRRRADFFLTPSSPEPYSRITAEKDFPIWFFKNILAKLNTLDEQLDLLKAFEKFYSCDRTEYTYGVGLFPFTTRLPKMNSMSLKPKLVFTNTTIESYDSRIRQEPEEFKTKLIKYSLSFVPEDYRRYYRKDAAYAFDIHPFAKQLGIRSKILLVKPKNSSKYYYFEDNPLLVEYMASFYSILMSLYPNYNTIFLTGFPIVFEHFDRNPYNCHIYTSPGFYSDPLFTLYNNIWNFIFSNTLAFRYFRYFECKSRIKNPVYIGKFFHMSKEGSYLPKILHNIVVNSEHYIVYDKEHAWWRKRFPDIIYFRSHYINIDVDIDVARGLRTYSRWIYLPYNHAAYIFVLVVKSIIYIISSALDLLFNWFYINQYLYFDLILYFNSYIKYKIVLFFNFIIFLGVDALWGVDALENNNGLLVYVNSYKQALFTSIPLFKLILIILILILLILLIILILVLLVLLVLNIISFKFHTFKTSTFIFLILILIFLLFKLFYFFTLYLIYILYFFYSLSYIFNHTKINFSKWKNNYFFVSNVLNLSEHFNEKNNYFFILWKRKKDYFFHKMKK